MRRAAIEHCQLTEQLLSRGALPPENMLPKPPVVLQVRHANADFHSANQAPSLRSDLLVVKVRSPRQAR
jgi:hypothetical protein